MKGELKKEIRFPVMEHFYSLQGEGAYSGYPAYFIRLAGCDVECHWCDVKESWDTGKYKFYNIKDLANIVANKRVIITGGEPLMWDLSLLTELLKKQNSIIHIETSGTHHLSGEFDWICLSPKKKMLPKEEIYKKANELKVIVYNQHDFIFAEEQAKKVNENCILFLQAEWSKREEMTPKIIEYILKNPQWNLSMQIHKYLNIL